MWTSSRRRASSFVLRRKEREREVQTSSRRRASSFVLCRKEKDREVRTSSRRRASSFVLRGKEREASTIEEESYRSLAIVGRRDRRREIFLLTFSSAKKGCILILKLTGQTVDCVLKILKLFALVCVSN